ncbi:pyridoxal phosphate phosphatase PHOSPHO2 [Harpegnathos saltator]|uniref:Pyridoxal phosphate phosphatase PHOSPHO2 n=1 Tax=Harpegnathos saltator TaxID=610380 RepID=E2BTU1_HARSA|nr:pyridoxal phosphate phosphatase PHOSPHO2 [Harpegnathos saltator]XP_011144971.1 pyridoxal phosphate phosphatase PHOSPHO2 [Harpegnathos saltator]XP_011144972.1 pyridoxal phosphate phosphatase PHOSPHO2 [Harpegnathos saltator]XP_011144973.1 pyridoxal phosphate phosphatase PHOSPHO2 [Harpegnathos saltator]XP_011144975.1 pyridoxal phosphate phosphatase PHOSPHO2 [Harpegnathos saltator]XP_011144976.1 pyridoxal phosphate phosphatase PHOSPHO2 [Harpegnathos saltator]XP_025153809.1 pyridoxal phosphate 
MNYSSLVVFDFDRTICEDNSDTVARKLLPEEKIPQEVRNLYQSNGWLTYMNRIFKLLHDNSIDGKQIKNAIVAIPAVAGMETLLTTLHANGHEIIIISDSNSLFINWWLQSKKLEHTVSRVFTNPAQFDEDGRLKVDMYHMQRSCDLSSMNLCKGKILMDFISEKHAQDVYYDRIVYIGDGKNDLCPILRLSEADLACPRKDYMLIKCLAKLPHNMHPVATIMAWKDGTDLLQSLEEALRVVKK